MSKLSVIVFQLFTFLCLMMLSFYPLDTSAKSAARVKIHIERVENIKKRDVLLLPYAFSTEDMGAIIGLGAMATGQYQKQMSVGGTVFGGPDSKGLGLGLWDYQLFNTERFFISAVGMLGDYPLLRAYAPLPNTYTPQGEARPGSNDSNFEDFFTAKGSSNWWEVKLEYVLPWGDAKAKAMRTYQLQGGLVKGGIKDISAWDPLTTGTTVAFLRQFNRYQLYKSGNEELDGAVHAIELGVMYEHTDFAVNPSQGSSQSFAYSYNPQWLESDKEWRFIEAEASKYFSFGQGEYTKQRILALNMWLGYSPSWQLNYDGQSNSQVVDNPPFIEGASLGGMYRMRGFRQNRFHDKAVIYTTAEYRMTLDYNPIADVNWLNFLNLDWFQTVVFVEGGRVSPTFNSSTLLKDWKMDAGVSLRALTAGIVVRFDVTKSSEGTNMWVMVGHPF